MKKQAHRRQIIKVKNIPSWEEFERLQRENPNEYKRLYCESMKCLNKRAIRIATAAIIISTISILLSLTEWLLMR